MIDVIKHGKTKFTATCANCGCEFTYELSDINAAGGVYCPDCGKYVAHASMTADESFKVHANKATTTPCVDR